MKKILVLGGSFAQMPFLKALKNRDYYIVLVDYLKDNPGQKLANEYYPLSTTDKESVLQLALKIKPDFVYSYASDPAAQTVAYLNEKLDLKDENDPKAMDILGEKNLFKSFLKKNGFVVPQFIEFDLNKNDNLDKFKTIQLPFILKPTDSSGSKGVFLVKDWKQLGKAIEVAGKFSRNKILIAEEFIDTEGEQIHGDVFVENGRIIFHHLGDHHFDHEQGSFVPFSTSWPSNQKPSDIERIVDKVQFIIELVGYKNGPMNIEARIYNDKVYLMEIGPRSGGNYVPLISYYSTGFNMIDGILNQLENIPNIIQDNNKKPTCYYVLRSFKPGVLHSIKIDKNLKNNVIEKFYYKNKGEQVDVFKGANDAIGILLLEFKNTQELQEFYIKANNFIQIEVN